MDFLKFAFSFLYVRDWHTGRKELSKPRLIAFSAGISLLALALVLIGVLQAPVEYGSL